MQDVPIRPFTTNDYAAWAALRTTLRPDHPVTAEELAQQDAQADPAHVLVRVVAEQAGRMIAVGHVHHEAWRFHPHKFSAFVWVDPAAQRRGVGAQVYDHLTAQVAVHNPIALRTGMREDNAAGLRFATQRGFVEEMRAWTSRLDVAAFDPTPFTGAVERVLAQGIRIVTLAELEQRDPECWQKLYDLDRSTGADLPGPDPYTHPPFAQWEQLVRYWPHRIPEAYVVALDGERYVGMSNLTRLSGTADLEVGYTAVERAYRGRGIALALKLCTIDYARSIGAPGIRTENSSTNAPMLRINTQLGFVRGVAWLTLLKALGRSG